MTLSIGGLWQEFFGKGIYQSISNKQNDKSIGLYTNYKSNVNGPYDMMVCCGIHNTSNLPHGVHAQTITAGKYARFIVQGDMQKEVAKFWMELFYLTTVDNVSSTFAVATRIDKVKIEKLR